MILTDNERILTQRFPRVLQSLASAPAEEANFKFEVIAAVNGTPTLVAKTADSLPKYIHSKYNPLQEAENVVAKYEGVEKYKHILFYGIGLGYHIEAFLEKFPNMTFSIYEPHPGAIDCFLQTRKMNELPLKDLKELFVENSFQDRFHFIQSFVNRINEEVLFVSFPGYERLDAERFKSFYELFRQMLEQKVQSMYADSHFQHYWTYNPILNLPFTFSTPNILDRQAYFAERPALVVSAGPSLQDELEHIRQIKANRSAYIVAVGSSINALLEAGVEPDAVFTYDPMTWNHVVYEKMIQRGIRHIPMIFGTTVGYRTLLEYDGPKFHMLMTPDTVSPYFFKRNDGQHMTAIGDAPTVANVCIEVLQRLGCSPVVLVGQNLAYRNSQMYAAGVSYENRNEGITEIERQVGFPVQGVDGTEVITNQKFAQMRRHLEQLIELNEWTNVINTTAGGAHIAGTRFVPLSEVASQYMQETHVHPEAFAVGAGPYNAAFMLKQAERVRDDSLQVEPMYAKMSEALRQLNSLISKGNRVKIDKAIDKFNDLVIEMEQNVFYNQVLRTINKLEFELLVKKIEEIRSEKSLLTKAYKIVQHHGAYMDACKQDLPLMQEKIRIAVDELKILSASEVS